MNRTKGWMAGWAVAMALGAWTAGAADYYVAQKGAAADDKNPGTLEKPFKTINAGLPKLKAGDTLWIREGTYRESLSLQTNAWSFGDPPGRPSPAARATASRFVSLPIPERSR